jgi:D-alanyl-lipoteichoic acid acyltransferase DltB (MBOAT superfamily)
MLFNSIDVAIFFPIVFTIYWVLAKNITSRNTLILLSSYVFYGWWDWRFLFLIIISSAVDFFVGKYIHKTKNKNKRKQLLLISLLVNLGFLFYFKYTNFFIETFVDSFRLFGNKIEVSTLNIILPVGISFYTFQTLSYTIDIYRKTLKPTKKWLSFFTFVAFFPQLVAGPIERASHLLPQFFVIHKFNYYQVRSGLLLMAFGLFKKMVIADRVAILVNEVYNNPIGYSGTDYLIATFFFAFQIYCDFSGYSDIAIGISRTMGFDLMKNFDSPYLSKSITEFWRRWHISLSTWFRDYVYIPLGGSRNGKYKTYLNLFIVFLVSGLWHGAALTFVIWGSIHGVIIVIEKIFEKQRKSIYKRINLKKRSFVNKIIFIPMIFTIVSIAWIFFRANNLTDAILILQGIIKLDINTDNIFDLGLVKNEFYLSIFLILILIFIEWSNKKSNYISFISRQKQTVRWLIYVIIINSIIILGVYGSGTPKDFIYFQF